MQSKNSKSTNLTSVSNNYNSLANVVKRTQLFFLPFVIMSLPTFKVELGHWRQMALKTLLQHTNHIHVYIVAAWQLFQKNI